MSDIVFISINEGDTRRSSDLVSVLWYAMVICYTHTSFSSIKSFITIVCDGWIDNHLRKMLHSWKTFCRSTIDDKNLKRVSYLYCGESDTVAIVGECVFELLYDVLYVIV